MTILDMILTRLQIWMMLFFAMLFLYMLRSNYSINMLAMVETTCKSANGSALKQNNGGMWPAINKLISQWSPPNEKGKFVSTLFGSDIGTVVTWSLCGFLIESFGWASAFYVSGMMAALFTLLWCSVVFDSPAEHPKMSITEKDYIENSLTGINTELKSWPPFSQMITSVPFWALLLLHYGHIWGFYFLLTAAPKFMSEVLGFKLSSAGFLASLPYLVRLFTGQLFGMIAHVLPGVLLLIIPYVGPNYSICIACMTLSFACNGAVCLSSNYNVHDLAPNYASTIIAIINAVATSAGFLSPMVVAYFTEHGSTINEWSKIFVVGSSVYIVPSFVFILFGSTNFQTWNEPTQSKSPIELEENNVSGALV